MPERFVIDYKRIVENVLTTLVTAIVIGACAIVWKDATSVEPRVAASEKNYQALVDNLASKLSAYELQLITTSNQLASIDAELKSLKPDYNRGHYRVEDRERGIFQQNIHEELLKR